MVQFSTKRPPYVYLFHHVAKCAGTSLVEALGQTGRQGFCLGFECDQKSEVRRSIRRQILQRRLSPSKIRAIFGHRVYWGLHHLCPQPARYFTFLRDPVARVISLYNYHVGIAIDANHKLHDRDRQRFMDDDRPIGFERWLDEEYSGNHQVRFLSYAMGQDDVHVDVKLTSKHLAEAKQFLDLCWFIGFAESSERDMPYVCEAVGVRPPSRRVNVSSDKMGDYDRTAIEKKIRERESMDLELFDYARQLRGTVG